MDALDGNAIAGALFEHFGNEMTMAQVRCSHCESMSLIAELRVYMKAPGAVARCPNCEEVLDRDRRRSRHPALRHDEHGDGEPRLTQRLASRADAVARSRDSPRRRRSLCTAIAPVAGRSPRAGHRAAIDRNSPIAAERSGSRASVAAQATKQKLRAGGRSSTPALGFTRSE